MSGPVATIVTGSSDDSSTARMRVGASRSSSGTVGSGSTGPPSAFAPWICSAGCSRPWIGPAAPAAIGMPSIPATVQAMRALSVVNSSRAW